MWRWREAGAAAEAHAEAGHLRREGLIRGLIGLAIACGLWFWKPMLAYVAGSLSGLVLLLALTSPLGAYRALGKGLGVFGHWVGRVIGVVALTPIFYLFFMVFGRLLRGGKRDRLERWFDRSAPTYWHRRTDPPRTRAYYERAF